MRATGLIVEYNPFHNGHLYQIEQARKICGSDYIVCVMSGNFIQRGEPALINKWARAKAALSCGADLVIELPVVYAMASAEYFAYGAVKTLDSLGVIESICFGSESGNIRELDLYAGILANEPDAYKEFLKSELEKGLSYPAARRAAIDGYLKSMPNVGPSVKVLDTANNILGIEYLKAIKKIKSTIVPYTIKRTGSLYNSQQLTGNLSSATAIRKAVLEAPALSDGSLQAVMPKAGFDILKEEIQNGRGPVFSSDFGTLILHELRKMTTDELCRYPYIGEGLENRFKRCANECGTLDELVNCICTKRYTRTRINRSLFCVLNGITSKDLETFVYNKGPQYIRVLGFNPAGREVLKEIKTTCSLPVIMKAADFKNSENEGIKRLLHLESSSTDIYVLGYKESSARKAGQEFTQNVIRVGL
jgi:cytidyltransferase-like protein